MLMLSSLHVSSAFTFHLLQLQTRFSYEQRMKYTALSAKQAKILSITRHTSKWHELVSQSEAKMHSRNSASF